MSLYHRRSLLNAPIRICKLIVPRRTVVQVPITWFESEMRCSILTALNMFLRSTNFRAVLYPGHIHDLGQNIGEGKVVAQEELRPFSPHEAKSRISGDEYFLLCRSNAGQSNSKYSSLGAKPAVVTARNPKKDKPAEIRNKIEGIYECIV